MDRRRFLYQFGTTALLSATPAGVLAQSQPFEGEPLRGTRSAADYGIVPELATDQTAAFQAMLDAAAGREAVFLPGGVYVVSRLTLPAGIHLEGIPGRSQIVHAGTGPLLRADSADAFTLRGLVIDGVDRPAGEDEGLIDLRNVSDVLLDGCTIRGAASNAIYLEACSGRLTDNTVLRAGQFAIFSRNGAGLTFTGNTIRDCRNGGIIVHRYEPGHDGAIVTGNRIENTGAANGGTGQWGNAINFFRTDDVVASGNMIVGSAFSAIRGNSVRNMQVTGNICRDSGETAIYAEFAFENAVIADNVVDGAANGISATNLDQGGHGATITGNIVRNLRTIGPYEAEFPGFGTGIGVEADAVVSGNLIEGVPLYGINAGWGEYLRNVVISENTIRDARFGIGVSVAEGAGHVLIRGNLIAATEAGIQPHEWGRNAGADLLADPAGAPASIALEANTAG